MIIYLLTHIAAGLFFAIAIYFTDIIKKDMCRMDVINFIVTILFGWVILFIIAYSIYEEWIDRISRNKKYSDWMYKNIFGK